jgi:hypothetical protein
VHHIWSAVPTTIPFPTGGSTIPGIPATPTGPGPSFGPTVSSAATGGLSLGSIAGVLVSALAIVVVLLLIGVFVIVVVANRADPDPSGRRPQSVYYFAVSFVTILTSIVGSAVVVWALVRLIGTHDSPIADAVARAVVLGGLVMLASLVLLVTHLRRGIDLARADPEGPGPSRRVGQSYVSAVAFVSMLVLLVVAILSVYLVFAIAGPGVFGSFGGRTSALRDLLLALYLGLVAVVVLRTHRSLVAPGLHLFGRGATDGWTGPDNRVP